MLKKLFSLSALILASGYLISCNQKSKDKDITLVMAEVNPEGTISAEMDKAFKEKVEELSEGKIKIDLHFGGSLGDEESVLKILMQSHGSIHLERISTFNLPSRGCEKTSLLIIPYTFSSRSHFWNFANSELAQTILNEPYEKNIGIKGLFYGEEGTRNFFSTKKINGIKDFEGIKLRVTDTIMKNLAEGLKAEPVSIAFGDLYGALQTGSADAADQPLANYLGNKFYQVAPNMILDGHTLGITEVVISSECWDSLSENQRDILTQAGKYAGDICKKISQEREEEAKARLLSEGVRFTDVSDFSPWQKACEGVSFETAKADPILYQKILHLTK